MSLGPFWGIETGNETQLNQSEGENTIEQSRVFGVFVGPLL